MARRHVRFTISYDGTAFHGSQRQPGVRTVQSELEAAASKLSNDPVRCTLAGRTDRGVHALGQVGNAWICWTRSLGELETGLNALTSSDLAVRGVREVGSDFHARFSARSREYRYRFWLGRVAPVFGSVYVWHLRGDFDVERARASLKRLRGEHDFASFAGDGVGVPGRDVVTIRRVDEIDVQEIDGSFFGADELSGRLVELRIRANAFLPHMVRNLAGVLAAVGLGRQSSDWIDELLTGRDRRLAGPAAPAQGLVLWDVGY